MELRTGRGLAAGPAGSPAPPELRASSSAASASRSAQLWSCLWEGAAQKGLDKEKLRLSQRHLEVPLDPPAAAGAQRERGVKIHRAHLRSDKGDS